MMAHPLAVSTPGRRSVFDSRYEIVATIGRGRNSVVYEARTLIDLPALPAGSQVALKVFTGSAKHPETNIERMRREATAMLASQHPNVIKLYDFVTTGDLCYLVMEFAERGDLISFMDAQKSPLTPQTALNLVKQMLFGLRAIHSAGIVHCDIKPENLLFSAESQVKIADFGVSLIPTEKNSLNEITGVGTFDYLAPEILSGGKYSAGSDIYAVGVTLFKLLTMHLPFAGETLTEQIDQKVRGERKSLADYVKKAPSYLEQLLDRSLAVNPVDRFQSAEEFQEVIDELIGNAADRGTTRLSAKSAAAVRDGARDGSRDTARAHLSLVPSNDEGIVAETSLPEVQHGEPQIKTGIAELLREALGHLNPLPLLGSLTAGPNGPLKSMLATASVVVAIWAASIYISGSGFAMERVAANANNNSPAPQEVIVSSGVLYNLLGENQHVSLIATVSRDDEKVLLSTDIPGWTPQLLEVDSLSRNGEVTLKSGGIQLTLSTGDSASVLQTEFLGVLRVARIERKGQGEKDVGCSGISWFANASHSKCAAFFILLSHIWLTIYPAVAQEKRDLEEYFAPNERPHLDQAPPDQAHRDQDELPPAAPATTKETRDNESDSSKQLPTPAFEHNIKLGHTVGIPSAVTLTTTEPKLEKIRVLFVLDGRLLALPLQSKQSGGVFFATFPTPALSLSYQFQFIHDDGSALVSENFSVDPHCSQRKIDRALSTANDFPLQASNLRRAAEVQQQSALFEYLAKAVTVLTE